MTSPWLCISGLRQTVAVWTQPPQPPVTLDPSPVSLAGTEQQAVDTTWSLAHPPCHCPARCSHVPATAVGRAGACDGTGDPRAHLA